MLLSRVDFPPSAAQSQSQFPQLTKSIELETALEFVDSLVFAQTGKYLSDVQRVVFRASWPTRRQIYDKIATDNGYSADYFKKDVGPKLWKLLSTVLGEKVSKRNFKAALERRRHSLLSNALQPHLDEHYN